MDSTSIFYIFDIKNKGFPAGWVKECLLAGTLPLKSVFYPAKAHRRSMLVYCRCIGFYNIAALVCRQSKHFTRRSASCPVF